MDPAETDPHPVSARSGSSKTGYRSGSGWVEIRRKWIHIRILPGRDPAKLDPDPDVAGSGCLDCSCTILDILEHFGMFGSPWTFLPGLGSTLDRALESREKRKMQKKR